MKVTLRGLRANQNLTVREAAKRLGIAPRTLQYWEYGRTYPNTKQLARICDVYKCGVEDIFLPTALEEN